MSSRTALSGKMFQEALKSIAYTIVWKDHGTAASDESSDNIDPQEVDTYMSATRILLAYYTSQDLISIYQANESQYQAYYNSIPDNLKGFLTIFRNYVEKNNYYRLISGYPPYGATDRDLFVPEVSPDIPVHELPWASKVYLDSIGKLDELFKSSGFRYLKYMTTRCIPPFIARDADKFAIMYIDNSNPEGLVDDFKKTYNKCRDYMISNHYSDAFKNVNMYYDGFVGMAILFMTITEMHYKYLEADIDRNFYELDSIKIVYESYGVPFVESIPLKYHQRIVKNINKLICHKGGNQVLFDICNLFDYNSMELHNYYLVKRHKMYNGNPVFEYDDSDPPKLKRSCYDIFFAKCEIGSDPYLAITDETNHLLYESVVSNDPYWIEDDDLLNLIYDSQYDYAETKYIGAYMVFNNTQLLYETAYFTKMLFDNKENTNKIFITHEYLGQKVSLYALIIYVYAAICKKHEWEGTIPTDPESIGKVFGFNYQANLNEIISYIIEDPDIENQLVILLNKIKTDTYTNLSNTYTVINKLNEFFEGKLITIKDKDVFYKYKSLRKLLMTTLLVNECFQKTDGTQASTYSELLQSHNIGLYSRLVDENIDLQDDIDYALTVLKKMSYDLEFIEYIDGVDSEKISDYLYELMNFFKSMMAQMAEINIVFLINPLDNMVKFLDTISLKEVRIGGPIQDYSLNIIDKIHKLKVLQGDFIFNENVNIVDALESECVTKLSLRDKKIDFSDTLDLLKVTYPDDFAFVSDIPFWDTINKSTQKNKMYDSNENGIVLNDSLYKKSEIITPGTYLNGEFTLSNYNDTITYYNGNNLSTIDIQFSKTLNAGEFIMYKSIDSETGEEVIEIRASNPDVNNGIIMNLPFISTYDNITIETPDDDLIIPTLELTSNVNEDSSLSGLLLFTGNNIKNKVGMWVVGSDLNTARHGLAGAGIQSDALSFGGTDGTNSAITEKFNGSLWSNTGNLNTARYYLGGCGTQTAGLSFGGNSNATTPTTELFNGDVWVSTNNLNLARERLVGCGIQSAGLSAGGYISTNESNSAVTEKFNGTSWSNSANLNNTIRNLTGCGIQSAALSFGGFGGSGTSAATEKFNGISWAITGSLNLARDLLSGCGTQTVGLSFGGYNAGMSSLTEKFNGSTWFITGNLAVSRHSLAGCGAQNTGLAFGGNIGVNAATTELFISTTSSNKTWTISGNLNTARYELAGCGTQSAGLTFGGNTGSISAVTEKFNGSTWGNSSDLNTARLALAGCGIQSAGLSLGGYNGSVSLVNTEKFNGSTWSSTGNLNTARYGLAGCGIQSAGLSFGGWNKLTSFNITEKFNGSTWSTTGNMNLARRYLAGCGTQSATLSFGGYIPLITVTEKFNGSTWSTTGNLNTASYRLAGCGAQSAGLAFGGHNDVTSLNNTELFYGSIWATVSNLNTARYSLAGCGIQSAGLSFGGNVPNISAITEKFDVNYNVSFTDDIDYHMTIGTDGPSVHISLSGSVETKLINLVSE